MFDVLSRRRFGFAVSWGIALACLTACASDLRRPEVLKIATGSPGGTYARIGADLARSLTEIGWTSGSYTSQGSLHNLELLNSGDADLALITQDTLLDLDPIDRRHYCVLGPLYRGGAQFIVARPHVRTGTVADLEGIRLYPGASGSGTEASTLALLEAMDIRPVYVESSLRTLGYDASAAAMSEGRFDAVALSGGPPVGAVERLLGAYPGKFVILSFEPDQRDLAISGIQGLYPAEIPGGTYPEHRDPIPTVGKQTLLIARSSLDDELLTSLADTLTESIQIPDAGLRDVRSHPALRGLTPTFWNQSLDVRRCYEAEALPEP